MQQIGIKPLLNIKEAILQYEKIQKHGLGRINYNDKEKIKNLKENVLPFEVTLNILIF